jgi:hypothetical protein
MVLSSGATALDAIARTQARFPSRAKSCALVESF